MMNPMRRIAHCQRANSAILEQQRFVAGQTLVDVAAIAEHCWKKRTRKQEWDQTLRVKRQLADLHAKQLVAAAKAAVVQADAGNSHSHSSWQRLQTELQLKMGADNAQKVIIRQRTIHLRSMPREEQMDMLRL